MNSNVLQMGDVFLIIGDVILILTVKITVMKIIVKQLFQSVIRQISSNVVMEGAS
jgi:hypothetical protein